MNQIKEVDLSKNELYQKIGKYLIENEFSLDEDESTSLEKGRNWYASNIYKVREIICNSYSVKYFGMSDRVQNRAIIIASIADIINPYFKGMPILSIAALIVQEGLETLCENTQKDEN